MQGVGERLLDAFRRIDAIAFGAGLERVEQMLRRLHANVAGQQQGFQRFEQFIVNAAMGKDRLQLAAPLFAGSCKSGFQPFPPGKLRRGSRCWRSVCVGRLLEERKHGVLSFVAMVTTEDEISVGDGAA